MPRDAHLVKKLREAGAVVLGKTNLTEWANYRGDNSSSGWSARGGQTKNPYVLDRNPDGSSSGNGVMVVVVVAVVVVVLVVVVVVVVIVVVKDLRHVGGSQRLHMLYEERLPSIIVVVGGVLEGVRQKTLCAG